MKQVDYFLVFLLILFTLKAEAHNLNNSNCSVTIVTMNTSCNLVNGSLIAVASGGGGFSYLWSTGATTQVISSLPQGSYSVTVVDGAGCVAPSSSIVSFDEEPVIEWQACFGGSNLDYPSDIKVTQDGGYIVCGSSYSNDGDVTGNHGGSDYWVIKLDVAGNLLWQKSYGGSNDEIPYSIQQTNDGGFIIVGVSASSNGDVTVNYGNYDYWVLKLDALGNIIWQKSYGGSAYDYAYMVQQTKDGGYIVIGNYGTIKLDNIGNVEWQNASEYLAIQEIDGGYFVVRGNGDYWVAELDLLGNIVWQNTYGGSSIDYATSFIQIDDGGYIVTGVTYSMDGDVTGNAGVAYWTLKLDSLGTIGWKQTTPTTEDLFPSDPIIKKVNENSFVIVGSYFHSSTFEEDVLLYSLDGQGNLIWQKQIGSNGPDSGTVDVTGDGGIILAAYAGSSGKDVTCSAASNEYWIVKLNSHGQFGTTTATIKNVSCGSMSDGSISIAATGGVSPYTYNWSNGETQSAISNLTAGNYTLTITDSAGCQIVTAPIAVLNAVNTTGAIVTVNNSMCESTGSIELTTTGGTQPYTFIWSNGSTQEDISNLPSGNYSCTMTDFNGCFSSVGPFTINIIVQVSITLDSIQPVSCFQSSDGLISISVSGGTVPYSYNWSNGSTQEDISNLAYGNYLLTVTDGAGCQTTASYAISTSNFPTTIQWEKSYGGSDSDNATSIQQTQDGGYIIAGITKSWDGDVSCVSSDNYWIVKLDPNGGMEWERCLDFGVNDVARSIVQTTDGGYLVTGTRRVYYAFPVGDTDPWTIKLDASGNIVWQYVPSGDYLDGSHDVIEMKNGGEYVVAGYYSIPILGNYYDYYTDFLIYKLNNTGGYIWWRTLGGSSHEQATAVAELNNGALIVTGWTFSNDGSVTGNHGGGDVWLVRMTGSGGVVWKKCFGGSNYDAANDIVATPDAGYILVGETQSNNGDVSYNHGGKDCWVVKLNSLGAIEWEKTYGGSSDEVATSIHATTDGGYIVTGYTSSNDGDVTGHQGLYDYWVFKIDAVGNIVWQKTFGGSSHDSPSSIDLTTDGGFVVAGYSSSTDGDVSTNKGYVDYWIVKSGFPEVINTQIDSIQSVSCNSLSDGSIGITSSGGLAPYTYQWSNGSTTEDISNLTTNDYSVTITDSNGCLVIKGPINVGALTTIGATIDQVNPISCSGDSDGSISITPSGGNPPYNYLWSNGSTSEDVSNLFDGSYHVTVTDLDGCYSVYGPVVVDPISEVGLTVNLVQPVFCSGDSDGSISITPSGGNPPYTYLWSNGATTEDISGLVYGNYIVVIEDVNGCVYAKGPITVNTTINPISVNIDLVQPVSCNGDSDGSISITPTGGNSPYTYHWSNGSIQEDISNLPSGNYTCTVIDVNGCATVSSSIVLSNPTAITLASTITNESMPGANDGTIQLTTTGGSAPYSFYWDTGATTEDISGLAPGNYCVTITDSNSCLIDSCFTVDFGTNSFDLNGMTQFELYPNPANSYVTCTIGFSSSVDLNIRIVDVLGQVIFVQAEYNVDYKQFEIDLSGFAAGTYLVSIEVNGEQTVKKLVLIR